MKLQFDAIQDFQLDAINAAVDLFKVQHDEASDIAFSKVPVVGGTFLSIVANKLSLFVYHKSNIMVHKTICISYMIHK